MRHRNRWILAAVMIVVPLLLAGCGGRSAEDAESLAPATVVQVPGTDLNRITLTPEAAARIDVRTVPASAEPGGHRTVIPYAAVLYSPSGEAWAYVNEKPLTFVRHRIVIDHIEGQHAILSSGPSPGTKVATVGVSELFGTETDVGE